MAKKFSRRAFLVSSAAFTAILSACGSNPQPQPTAGVVATQNVKPPKGATATIEPTRPEATWQSFLALWEQGQYESMYDYLTSLAHQETTREQFTAFYQKLAATTGLQSTKIETTSALVNGPTAQVSYRIMLSTERFGTLEENHSVTLAFDGAKWLVAWEPSQVLNELAGGGSLNLQETEVTRGAIYDRNGHPLASLGTIVVVGVVPGEIEDEPALLKLLAEILEMSEAEVKEEYANAARPDWFMPVGELTAQKAQEKYSQLDSMPGITMREKPVRFYPEGANAAHITGYISVITAEQWPELRDNGYHQDDLVGQTGVEKYFEEQLAGKRGQKLLALGVNGEVKSVIAEKQAVQSKSLYTTIDFALQKQCLSLLKDKQAAIVVLNPNNGQVLALASNPTFDPNIITSGASPKQWNDIVNDEKRPLMNRACQSELPPGSTFKIVSESAALESGLFTPQSAFTCTGTWTGLGSGWPKTCWLHTGHGSLDLAHGLTVSCDVVFYEIGKALQEKDRDILPKMANAFGFGARTGIDGVAEAAGLVPTAAWKEANKGEAWFPGDSVNMAIGQGYVLVTPLQMTRAMAAIANGGTLYEPRLAFSFDQKPDASGSAFTAKESGKLPVTAEHLASIRQSLLDGCMSPAGTAYSYLGNMAVAVAGKTGTAENPGELPHAWFCGYAPADKPEIVVTVVIENGGEGSKVAAPIFRQVVEAYFTPT